MLSLFMLQLRRERLNQHQSSQEFPCSLGDDTALIGWITEIGGEIVGKNGSDDCVIAWDWW